MKPEMNEPDKRTILANSVMELEEEQALALVSARLAAGDDPQLILEDVQDGLRLVGLRYEARQYYVAGLMMAGEIFRQSMELLEPKLVNRLVQGEAGHILLGTVQGDIHNIGKNVFATIARCSGFTVHDLGENVPPGCFIKEVIQQRPDIIGMSGLITSSHLGMKATVQQVHQIADSILARTPIIIGGCMVDSQVCAFVGADYWATDAVVGVRLCKQIIADRKAGV
jgi:methanogenic corrinoid protein MtbC1